MAPHGKELFEDLKRRIVELHEDGQGYKKIAKTRKLSCSTVAKITQRFKRAGPLRSGLGYVIQRNWVHVLSVTSKCFLWKIGLGMLSALLQRLKRWRGQPVSAQTIRRTLHQIGVHGCHPRRKPLLKTIHEKATKLFVEDMSTKHMDFWNYVLWSDEMKINLFSSDGFKHVWRRLGEEYKDKCVMPTVKHGGGNVMV